MTEPATELPPTPSRSRATNPFKGLAYFDDVRRDHLRFGGRDRDVTAVVHGILRSRTFILYGRSGLGKTSLVLAGVFPELKLHGCRPIYVRTLSDPLADLRTALAEGLGRKVTDIDEALRELSDGRVTTVLVFDQFEEFFLRFADQTAAGETLHKRNETPEERQARRAKKRAFVAELGRLAADSSLDLRLFFSLREDWIADMKDLESAIPEIVRHTCRLMPLTAFGVRQSIERSLKATGVAYDKRLISALVEKLADYGFDPAILQVTSSQVWRQARQRHPEDLRLRAEDLEEVGGIDGIFRRYLSRIDRRIPRDDLRLRIQARAVLGALITEKRTKQALARDSLCRRDFAITEEELDGVLELLVEHRLVRHDRRGGESWYELIHERLIDSILAWLDNDPEYFDFRAARNLVAHLARHPGWRENPGLLLSKAQLDGTLGRFSKLLQFEPEEEQFLISSAINAGSDDLETWAEQAGEGATVERLDALLGHSDSTETQLRAAQAASRLGLQPKHFARRLRELALDSYDEKQKDKEQSALHREASRAFALLASEDDFADLAAGLRSRERRRRALGVLVEAHGLERIPSSLRLGWRNRRRLRRAHFRRRLPEALVQRRHRGRLGALWGLFAALAWAGTAVPVGVRVAQFELQPEVATGAPWAPWLMVWAGCVIWAILLGPLVGWLVARRDAREVLLGGREGTAFGAVCGRGVRLLAAILVVVPLGGTVVSLLLGERLEGPAEGLFGFLAVVIGTILAFCGVLVWGGLLARLYRPLAALGGPWRQWLRPWLWAFGGSLVLPLCAWIALARIQGFPEPDDLFLDLGFWSRLASFVAASFFVGMVIFLVVSAVVGGLLTFVSLVGLGRCSPGWNPALAERLEIGRRASFELPPRRRWLLEAVGLGLFLAAGILLFVANRFDSVLPATLSLSQDGVSHRLASGSAPVDATYVRLRGHGGPAPRLVQLSFPHDLRARANRPGKSASELLQPQQTLVVPRFGRRLSFARQGPRSPAAIIASGPQELELVPDSPTDEPLDPERSHLVVVPLEHDRSLDRWQGTLKASFAGSALEGSTLTFATAVQSAGPGCDGGRFRLRFRASDNEDWRDLPVTCGRSPSLADFTGTPLELMADRQMLLDLEVRGQPPAASVRLGGAATAVSFSPVGELLAASESGAAYVWDPLLQDFPQVGSLPRFAHGEGIVSAAWSTDGAIFATGSQDRTARVWRSDSYEPLATLFHGDVVWGVAFDPSGTRLVTASADNVVRVWRWGRSLRPTGPQGTDRPSSRLEGAKTGPVVVDTPELELVVDNQPWKATFSHDGSRLAAAATDMVYLWDEAGELLQRLPHPAEVYAVAFSADDRLLLTGAADGRARVYELGATEPMDVLHHDSAVWSAIFHDEDQRIITGDEDGNVRFFRAGTGTPAFAYAEEDLLLPLGHSVWSLAVGTWAADSFLAAATADGSVRVWPMAELEKSDDHDDPLYVFARLAPAAPRSTASP